MTIASGPLKRAYGACGALARSHYENFPVASRLLPAAMRPHVAAVYAFARVADDIADEGTTPAAERLEHLGAWQQRLHAAVAIEQSAAGPADDLVSAFGQDTMTTRYDSWRELFDYCRRSANPIGRLVLRIAGYRSEHLDRSSDALCTALQLTNLWQDLGRDWSAGRLYVPREVYTACGATEDQLRSRGAVRGEGAPGVNLVPWTRAMAECVRVTHELFRQGRMVCDGVVGRLRYELRFTWLGGCRILERVERRGARLIVDRPALGAADLPVLVSRAVRWSAQT